MDDRYNAAGQPQLKKQPRGTIAGDGRPPFRRTKHMGIMVFLVSSGLLLMLSGSTIAATVFGLVCFAPVIIITSPIWVPLGIVLLFVGIGILFLCVFGLVAAAVIDVLVVQVLMKRLRVVLYEELFERNQSIYASKQF